MPSFSDISDVCGKLKKNTNKPNKRRSPHEWLRRGTEKYSDPDDRTSFDGVPSGVTLSAIERGSCNFFAFGLLSLFVSLLLAPFAAAAAMKPIMLLHVGPWKTGSTHIQTKLNNDRQFLETKNIFMPLSPRDDIVQHCQIKEHNTFGQTETLEFLNQTKHNMIVTCEGLFNFYIKDYFYKGIPPIFDLYDVHVVYFHRNTWSKMLSEYRYLVKVGSVQGSFPDHVLKSQEYDQDRFIDGFIEKFGRSNVHIIDYAGCLYERVDIYEAMVNSVFGRLIIPRIERRRLDDNTSPNGHDVLIMELIEEFEAYVLHRFDCILNLRSRILRKLLDPMSMLIAKFVRNGSVPVFTISTASILYSAAKAKDALIRSKYSDILLNAGSGVAAVDAELKTIIPVSWLRIAELRNAKWNMIFRQQLLELPANVTEKCLEYLQFKQHFASDV